MERWRFLEIDGLTYAETAICRPVLIRPRGALFLMWVR